jgi:hypothetical protein
VLGQASGRGAADHRSYTDGLIDETSDFAEDPIRDEALECQRPKLQLLGPLQPVLASTEGFPEHVPLALQRLGDRLLAYVPAEFTISAGQRLRRAVERHYGADAKDRALVVGLANAYMQYITTPEEYQLQYYEGGSNLYGPQSLEFFGEIFGWLAVSLRGGDVPPYLTLGVARSFEYSGPPERPRFPTAEGKSAAELGAARRARFVCRADVFDPPAICFGWSDASPGRVAVTQAPWLRLLGPGGTPVPTCWQRLAAPAATTCDGALPVDDRGFDFFTWSEGRSHEVWHWSTLYRPSQVEWDKLRGLASLELVAGDISSGIFSVSELRACRDRTLRSCMKGAL